MMGIYVLRWFLFIAYMLLPVFSFASNERLDNFIQRSINDPKESYILVKGASWCNPCRELEKYTQTNSLKKWPHYQSAKKMFLKEDLFGSKNWKTFSLKLRLPDSPAFPVVYIFREGKLKSSKVASSPWEIEAMLKVKN